MTVNSESILHPRSSGPVSRQLVIDWQEYLRCQGQSQAKTRSNYRAPAEEVDSIRRCLSICAYATEQATKERVNVIEDVSLSDDGHQVIVTILGDLISARGVRAGARSKQWLVQMSDASLQQLSKNGMVTGVKVEDSDRTGTSKESSQDAFTPCFTDRHSKGRKLS